MDYHNFHGKNIPHIEVNPDMKIDDLIEIYANSGYNARQLEEDAKLFRKMIEDDATICLTIAGAMILLDLEVYSNPLSKKDLLTG